MATGFTVAQTGNYTADLDDILIRREYFSDGNLWCWGRDTYGQLGDNNTVHRSSPVQTVAGGTNWKKLIAPAYESSMGIKTDSTLWVWGLNTYGQLGDNTNADKPSPVQTISGGTNWKQVSGGQYHSAAVKTDGTLWCWGYNVRGQLGDNSTGAKSSPVQTVASGTTWKQVACGMSHTVAIKTDGTLWGCGYNGYGELGDNTLVNKSSPIQTIAGGTDWNFIACGFHHTMGIKNDGSLWFWGYNGYGQFGNNTQTSSSSPIQTMTGGANWKQVTCGFYHTMGIKTDGTLWGWGLNVNGQLGDNTNTDKWSPVQTIAGGTNWKYISCHWFHNAAVKTDGTLWTWGDNTYGELGDNTIVNKSSPIQTIAGGTNWRVVSACAHHMMAITDLTF